jgi:hypothetical protein
MAKRIARERAAGALGNRQPSGFNKLNNWSTLRAPISATDTPSSRLA